MIEIRTTRKFDVWLSRLKDRIGKAAVVARIRRLGLGNEGDCKPVGDGVRELRIHVGPGYRVYFKRTNDIVVILLCAGDKTSQDRDIRKAKDIASHF